MQDRFRGYPRNEGYERARQHILEAEELSQEVGGTDQDVKDYFFSLSPHELRSILQEYGRLHGWAAQQYAEETMPMWRSGQRRMSGLVASRLFRLLPRYMPAERKYALVKSLWEHCSPATSRSAYVGPDLPAQQIAEFARRHFQEVIQAHTISELITRRFDWLAAGDVKLRQELYNYFLQLDMELLTSALPQRLQIIIDQLNDAPNRTARITQRIEIGRHTLDLYFAPTYSGISDHAPVPEPTFLQKNGCILFIVIVVLLVVFLRSCS